MSTHQKKRRRKKHPRSILFKPDLDQLVNEVCQAEERSRNWMVNRLVEEALAARGISLPPQPAAQ